MITHHRIGFFYSELLSFGISGSIDYKSSMPTFTKDEFTMHYELPGVKSVTLMCTWARCDH